MENKKTLFMVMKLSTDITYTNQVGTEVKQKLEGCYGYIPVFETIEEAEEMANDGELQIIMIQA